MLIFTGKKNPYLKNNEMIVGTALVEHLKQENRQKMDTEKKNIYGVEE